MLPLFAAVFLLSGAALDLVNLQLDSVVILHISRSAMIFGLVGLRRTTHGVTEAHDNGSAERP